MADIKGYDSNVILSEAIFQAERSIFLCNSLSPRPHCASTGWTARFDRMILFKVSRYRNPSDRRIMIFAL